MDHIKATQSEVNGACCQGLNGSCESSQPHQPTKAERLITEAMQKVDEANALNQRDAEIQSIKEQRVALDGILQNLKGLPESFEVEVSTTRLKESIMWLGMELKRLGETNPYPNSYDATNAKVDPTADGLKL